MENRVENKKEIQKENKIIGILVLVIVLIVCIVAVILFMNADRKEEVQNSDIEKIVKDGKNAIIYVENSDKKKCDNCNDIKKYLNDKDIDYIIYDVKNHSKSDYNKMLQSLNINPNDFGYPAVVYIKNGSVYSDVINIRNNKTVNSFITDYDLTKVKQDNK